MADDEQELAAQELAEQELAAAEQGLAACEGAGAATMAMLPSATAEPRTSMDFLSVRIVCSSDYVCAAAHRTDRRSAFVRCSAIRHKQSSGCTITGHSRVSGARYTLPDYASPRAG
ncbi:MAG: hypothetical protein CVT81_02205 [Alphaproteobacteria bacterium HGW-Alphaproteobacteria-3]|nr:MAG: hypothetical protein CVT81_02205 [Alphaproteobacteria bacterium HGW-Alphaproteobacteria-3]